MARPIAPFCLLLLTMFSAAASAADREAAFSIEAVEVPAGFGQLELEHETVVDVYFGGRRLGSARAVAHPGFLRFKDPFRILALVPNVAISSQLSAAIAAELPANAALVCASGSDRGCGRLSPSVAGIIFDEDHFRVDLFVNSKWLHVIRPREQDEYLPEPTAPLALTSSTGLALSGSSGSSPVYNIQNQTILGFRNARIRSDSSYASRLGLVMDTMVGEVDRPGFRYSAGLFWAPGLDLTGPRRIAGFGIATQFDTRTDRDTLRGTPLLLFLSQPARVEILQDGRLLSSASYEAGNNILDTSTLPDGSYSLLLRIHEANGGVREERRFFAKNLQVAPIGRPVYFAYAGKLANTRRGAPVSLSDPLFYQFGTARRLGQYFALDLSVIGSGERPMAEAGAWLVTPLIRVRAAALGSIRGDSGALLQLASGQDSPVSLNLDLRRINSRDGRPLIPLSAYEGTFETVDLDGRHIGNGSYTQASGSIGYQLGTAYLELAGSLRKDEGLAADYSIGPNLNWPVVNSNGLQIALHADGQLSSRGRAGYLGMRMFFNRGNYSVSSNIGRRGFSGGEGEGRPRQRTVGDTTAHLSFSRDDGMDVSLAAGMAREAQSSSGHAEALVRSSLGSARGQVVHDFEGGRRTQYGLALQTGAILDRYALVVGGRNLAQSAVIVSVEGGPEGSQFEILVDDRPRGRVKAGGRIPIFLEPYRGYSLRLRPVGAASVWFDAAERAFTLYPGNVQQLTWRVEHLLTVFGQAVGPDGKPIADAIVTSRRGIGQSDSNGFFQVETSVNDSLAFDAGRGAQCKVTLPSLGTEQDYAAVGKVMCR